MKTSTLKVALIALIPACANAKNVVVEPESSPAAEAPAKAEPDRSAVLAVYDITVRSNAAVDGPKMSMLLEGAMARSGFQTVPRASIAAAIEQKKAASMGPCIDEACQIEIGKEVAAQKLATSEWVEVDGSCVFDLRIYDLKTAVSESSFQVKKPCTEGGLLAAIEEAEHGIGKKGAAPQKVQAQANAQDTAAPPSGGKPTQTAASFRTANQCEEAARVLHDREAATGWNFLKACVARGDFTAIRKLLESPWHEELQKRPQEAASVLAPVIAARGANIDDDLKLCHEKQIPLFTLKAAMADPDTYRDRWVLMRGVINPKGSTGSALQVVETTLKPEDFDRQVGDKTVYENQSSHSGSSSYSGAHSGNYSARGNVNSNNWQSRGSGSANYSGQNNYAGNNQSRSSWSKYQRDTHNVAVETGRNVTAKLQKPDPFLEHGKEYVFLGLFRGTQKTMVPVPKQDEDGDSDDGDDDPKPMKAAKVGVLSVITYSRPAPEVTF